MVKYENGCVNCGLPCMGEACRYIKMLVCYCDHCGREVELGDIITFDDVDLCKVCALEYIDEEDDDSLREFINADENNIDLVADN